MKASFERLRNRTPVGWLQLRRTGLVSSLRSLESLSRTC
jgi:hypothetical protein